MCDFLSDEYDIECGIHIVGYILKELKMTHKVAHQIHAKQDDELYVAYYYEPLHEVAAQDELGLVGD